MDSLGVTVHLVVIIYHAHHSYEMPAPPEGFDSTAAVATAETIQLVPQPPTQMTFRDPFQANKFTLCRVN